MTTEPRELSPAETIAGLLDANYVFGVDGGRVHAVNRVRLQTALRHNGPLQADTLPHLPAAAMCGARVVVATAWGPWSRTSPHVQAIGVCPHCAWHVAIDTLSVAEELAALRPTDSSARASFTAAGVELDLVATVCAAVIAAAEAVDDEHGLYHPRTVDLLAHVTAHGPVLLVGEGCSEGDCDHEDGPCPADVSCEACSLVAGSWAGEWAGQYDEVCTVPGPCQVFRLIAEHHGVTVPAREVPRV